MNGYCFGRHNKCSFHCFAIGKDNLLTRPTDEAFPSRCPRCNCNGIALFGAGLARTTTLNQNWIDPMQGAGSFLKLLCSRIQRSIARVLCVQKNFQLLECLFKYFPAFCFVNLCFVPRILIIDLLRCIARRRYINCTKVDFSIAQRIAEEVPTSVVRNCNTRIDCRGASSQCIPFQSINGRIVRCAILSLARVYKQRISDNRIFILLRRCHITVEKIMIILEPRRSTPVRASACPLIIENIIRQCQFSVRIIHDLCIQSFTDIERIIIDLRIIRI